VSKRITVLLNRNARGLRQPVPLLRALAPLRDCRLIETHTLADLETAARELATERPELVVLAGGDGSVMSGLTAVSHAWGSAPLPRFAIIPAGTVSTIAKNLGLPRRHVQYARSLVDAALAGRARTMVSRTLRVRDAAGGDRVGFIFGTGSIAQFFELYDDLPESGVLPASKLVAQLVVGAFTRSRMAARVLAPEPLTLELEGRALPHARYSVIVSSVLRDLGLHLRPTFRAGEDPERLHVVASTRGPMNLALQVPVVMAGARLVGGGHVDALAKAFSVRFEGSLRSYVLDGDRLDAGSPSARVAPWVTVERGPDIQLAML
jgi:hypothetical protein